MIRIVNYIVDLLPSTELLEIKWKYSPTKEFVVTEWKIPEHLGTDSSLNTSRYGDEKVPNGQEVCQSLLVNIPAVTENHPVCDVG